jgi:hypothetical protein
MEQKMLTNTQAATIALPILSKRKLAQKCCANYPVSQLLTDCRR